MIACHATCQLPYMLYCSAFFYYCSVNIKFRDYTYFLSLGPVVAYFHTSFYSLWNGGLQQELSTLQFEHPGYELWVTASFLASTDN